MWTALPASLERQVIGVSNVKHVGYDTGGKTVLKTTDASVIDMEPSTAAEVKHAWRQAAAASRPASTASQGTAPSAPPPRQVLASLQPSQVCSHKLYWMSRSATACLQLLHSIDVLDAAKSCRLVATAQYATHCPTCACR